MTIIAHLTVDCSVTWPLNGREAGVDHVLKQTSLLLLCISVVLKLTSLHLNEKHKEVCIKASSTLASVAFIGQVTEHTTVKWPVHGKVDIE